jgi:hypothetical protein
VACGELRRPAVDFSDAQIPSTTAGRIRCGYQPMAASGARLSNLFSCRRGDDFIAIVPRFGMSVADDWQDTHLPLPEGEWRNLFADSRISVTAIPAQLFGHFPVAALVRVDSNLSRSLSNGKRREARLSSRRNQD